jgi:hypothetical protein
MHIIIFEGVQNMQIRHNLGLDIFHDLNKFLLKYSMYMRK